MKQLVFASVLATAMGAAPQDGGKGDESKGWGSGATTGAPILSKEHHNAAEVNKSHHRHLFGFRRLFGSKLQSTTPIPVVKALQNDTAKEESQSRSHRFVTTVRNLMHRNRNFNETKGNQTQHSRKWKKMLWKHRRG